MSIENFIFIKIDLSQPLFLFSSFQCSPFEKTHVLYNNLPMGAWIAEWSSHSTTMNFGMLRHGL